MDQQPTEIDYLRKEIAELRDAFWEKTHESAKEIGYSKEWQTLMQDRFAALEARLDNLVLALLQNQPAPTRRGKPKQQPALTTRTPDQDEQQSLHEDRAGNSQHD